MKTIIAPTDFSAVATNAAYYAADMALALQTNLLLVHAVALPVVVPEAPVSPEMYDVIIDSATEQINELKKNLSERVNDKIYISVKVVTTGLLNELENLSDPATTFAVVMGIQGSGASVRLLFGSNTLAAMRRSHLPLVIVPHEGKFKMIKKLGLACDMHHTLETMPVTSIKQLINIFNCSLDILYVYDSERQNPEMLPESLSLKHALEQVHPHFHYINDKDIEKGIASFVKLHAVDLLLVIPKPHSLIDTIFHKSISKDIALHLDIPIMALRKEKIPALIGNS